ncbi:hypothetical protein R1flu_011337 [Riccia fluitans]|uniref:CRAL-TRIO domain-containing protein n=1 Tax=Riccia fluitans TaxID=41844 RepID=A0ABD1Z7Q3_9MARC
MNQLQVSLVPISSRNFFNFIQPSEPTNDVRSLRSIVVLGVRGTAEVIDSFEAREAEGSKEILAPGFFFDIITGPFSWAKLVALKAESGTDPMKKNAGHHDPPMTPSEEQAKVKELRSILGPLSGRSLLYCTDDCLARFLRARSWNIKKAEKMLKEALKWRASYKPEEIKWDDVMKETETGKVYRANFRDKCGRSVIVMRPGNQNTHDLQGQIKQLVYTIENAIVNLPPDQEQMVWLIDFKGWSLRKAVSVSTARETAHVLQNMYPERLNIGILFDPPRIFETFWAIVKPFLDPKTFRKVYFVYSKNPESSTVLEELFDMDKLETGFGGRNSSTFNFEEGSRPVAAFSEGDPPLPRGLCIYFRGRANTKYTYYLDEL